MSLPPHTDHLVALPPGMARLVLVHDASPIMPVTSCLLGLADLDTLLEHLDGLGVAPVAASHQLLVAHTCGEDAHDGGMHNLDLSLTAAEIDEVVSWVTARRCG